MDLRKHLRLINLGGILMLTSVLSFGQSGKQDGLTSWSDAKRTGKGFVKVYWYESRPFIYANEHRMRGIEAEIFEGFARFIKQKHQVDMAIKWQEAVDFGDTYGMVRDKKEDGTFGLSAFSITPDRLKEVGFSPPYMADISVLISSKSIPIVQSMEEFNRIFPKLTAVTIKQTTYEQDLLKLRSGSNLSFKIKYIPSQESILKTIERMDSAFGFIDLPIYMMEFNNDPSVNVKRQNLFPVKQMGYSVIYPINSDWSVPVAEYFNSEEFKSQLETIIAKYIDRDLYHFVESLAIQSNDPVILLTKEKEIQQRDLLGKTIQILQEIRRRNFMFALAASFFAFLLIIILLYRKRSEQKRKIEAQGKSLAEKTDQLEKRNQHLVTLDQEKNNLIKILAHDLRTPINHVQGLAQILLLSNEGLPEDQKSIIRKISDSSVRLNKMITSILDIDAIENDRVKIYNEEVDIVHLVRQVVNSFDKQASKKNIALTFSSSGEKSMIQGDSLFLTQIFENLLSNAIKFSEHDKGINTTVTEVNNKVTIRVQDQGPGLTEDDMQSLFKKFKRLSAHPTDGESSMGLGLAIVKKYVELMNGRVWCESVHGKGATFLVEFELTQL